MPEAAPSQKGKGSSSRQGLWNDLVVLEVSLISRQGKVDRVSEQERGGILLFTLYFVLDSQKFCDVKLTP
jgi:hypothetical protein